MMTNASRSTARRIPRRSVSNSHQEPQIAEPAQHEREAVAFWFRRLSTILIFSNGAGIIAIGSFLSGKDDLAVAAVVAYPAMSLFATGAISGAASFFLSLLYTTFRIDAYAERENKRVQWRESRGLPAKINHTPIVAAFVFLALQFAAFGSGILYFYAGSRVVITGLGDIACRKAEGLSFCKDSGTPLFPTSDLKESDHSFSDLIVSPRDSDGGVISNQEDATISASSERVEVSSGIGDRKFLYSNIFVSVKDADYIVIDNAEIPVRFTANIGDIDESECWVDFIDSYSDGTSPISISPKFVRMMRRLMDYKGRYSNSSIVWGRVNFTISYKKGDASGINFLELGAAGLTETQRPIITGRPSAMVTGPDEVTVVIRKGTPSACQKVARALGFRLIEF